MKLRLSLPVSFAMLALISLSACVVEDYDDDHHDHHGVVDSDYCPPAIPRGLYSVTHDGYIVLAWLPVQDYDLAGYNVYYAYQAEGPYQKIAYTQDTVYYDEDVRNGITYFYAVTAVDRSGNESDLSPELIYDTPRPEGSDVILYNFELKPAEGGFNFASGERISADSPLADIRFSCIVQSNYFFVQIINTQTQIQDFGYCLSLDQVNYAPDKGWSQIGEVEAIAGHAYVMWTADNHFAKFWIREVNSSFIRLDWAYQIDPGNPELMKGEPSSRDSLQVNRIESH
ncbi:MAG: hypothetical protein KBA26_04930 [Candidatus Delongbacteria bacterium]|nr:hypothetical protein [Candidatus Delongbacteria bacterium]